MNNGTGTANPFAGFSSGLKVTLEDVKPRQAGGQKAPQAPVPEGKYDAYVSAVTAKIYGTGSAGIQVAFTISSKDARGRKLTENFILVNKQGEQSKVGVSRFIRLLQATGLSTAEINAFRMPTSEHETGDLNTLLNKDVQIQVKADGEYEGKARRKVSAIYPPKQEAK